jgi:hypothetical protein
VHVFTEPLPRQQAAAGSCDHCERPVHRHEAPQTPRKFEYAARDIAAALLLVGEGMTYRAASAAARAHAGRVRVDPWNG